MTDLKLMRCFSCLAVIGNARTFTMIDGSPVCGGCSMRREKRMKQAELETEKALVKPLKKEPSLTASLRSGCLFCIGQTYCTCSR